MEYLSFPALLRSKYNSIHEYGQGNLTDHTHAIDFTSDFVPLLPLNTEAVIEWVFGEKTIAQFGGNVYLSSQSMLRLIDIDKSLLAKARSVLSYNTRIPGSIKVKTKGKPLSKQPRLSVEILYLSYSLVKLRVKENVNKDDILLLSAEIKFLTLRDLVLRVRQKVTMRKNETLLLCNLESGGNDNFVALSAYIAKLEQPEST